MSFLSTKQQIEAIETLVEATGLPALKGKKLFIDEQPSQDLIVLADNRGMLSHGEQVMLDVILDFWRYGEGLKLFDLHILSPTNIEFVTSLFVAFCHGPYEVERWIGDTKEYIRDQKEPQE